jgi:ABC-type sugar transport system substrate-binding protein
MSKNILVSLLDEKQDFQAMQADDARAAGSRLGLHVEVVFAENHPVLQIQQLYKGIHAPEDERAGAILVEPAAGEGFERVARNAVQAGIAWILVNMRPVYVAGLRSAHPDVPVSIFGTDQVAVGRIQGRQCRALRPGGGRVLSVQGPADSTVTRERGQGFEEGLGAGFDVRVLNGDWTTESAAKAVSVWLRLKTAEAFTPDIVAAQNDLMATGARQALKEHQPQWANVRYLGCDGLPEGGQKQVREGALASTVITPSNTGPALEAVARWLETGTLPPREVLLEPVSFPPEADIRPSGA